MKITIIPKNSDKTIVIEGELNELDTILSKVVEAEKPKTTTVSKPVSKSVQSNSDDTLVNQYAKFLDSIYVYPANPNSDSGKGRYIAQMLGDNKPHTFSEIEKAAKVVPNTVVRNINKLRGAGAVISVEGQTVTLKSFPITNAPRKRKTWTNKSKSNTKVLVSKTESLKGLKLS